MLFRALVVTTNLLDSISKLQPCLNIRVTYKLIIAYSYDGLCTKFNHVKI